MITLYVFERTFSLIIVHFANSILTHYKSWIIFCWMNHVYPDDVHRLVETRPSIIISPTTKDWWLFSGGSILFFMNLFGAGWGEKKKVGGGGRESYL